MVDFIEIYPFTDNEVICDRLIEYFNSKKDNHNKGVTGSNRGIEVDGEIKDSTDLTLSVSEIKNTEEDSSTFFPVINILQTALNMYIEKYDVLDGTSITLADKFNIQHYKKGQHFKKLHYESSMIYKRKRILVWMFYLNSVAKGGCTNFPYLELSIQPSKSHLLIWPADFTHSHFGDITEEDKYIMTGWFEVGQKELEISCDKKFHYFNF